MTRSIDDARQALDAQPFSRLVQAQLLHYTAERVEMQVPVTPQILQQHGFVHGGVVSYLADNALTFAGGIVLGPGVVTSEYKINYVRPAVGERLVARAAAVHAGRTQAVCRCEVYVVAQGIEKLCAVAQGTIALMGARTTD